MTQTTAAGARTVRLPKVAKGYKRQWRQCRACKCVAYYDYVPYSLSNPIMCMPCPHGIGQRDMNADYIDEKTARAALAKTGGAK